MRGFIVYCLPIILFFGCGLFRDEETKTQLERPEDKQNVQQKNQDNEKEKQQQEQEEGPKEKADNDEVLYSSKVIIDREKLKSRHWITAEAKAGDKLLITLEGIEQIPSLVEETLPYDDFSNKIVRNCLVGEPCSNINPHNRHPNCFVRYHKVNIGKENIIFPNDVFSLDIRIEINEKLYPIGRVVEYKETEIVTEFIIDEDMTDKEQIYTNAYIIVQRPNRMETMMLTGPVSLVNPDECPTGLEQLLGTGRIPVPARKDYFATVTLKKRAKGD